jgi:hypothetical protein
MNIINILKKIWKSFSNYFMAYIIIIAVIVGLIVNDFAVGFYTFFGEGIVISVFIGLRQLYWYITKTGDYENKNTKK